MSEETKFKTFCYETTKSIKYYISILNNKTFIIIALFVASFIVSLWGKNSAWPLASLLIVYVFYDDLKKIIKRIKKLPGGTELTTPTGDELKDASDQAKLDSVLTNKQKSEIQKVINININDSFAYNALINDVIFDMKYKGIKVDKEVKLQSYGKNVVFDGKYLDSETGKICFVEIKNIKTFSSYIYIDIRKMLSLISDYSLDQNFSTRLDFVICGDITDKQKNLLEGHFFEDLKSNKLRFSYISRKELNLAANHYVHGNL